MPEVQKMTGNNLAEKNKWEEVWTRAKLPSIQKPPYEIVDKLARYLPATPEAKFIEIGCAPGGWMVYFAKRFGYTVIGLEYAEEAATITKKNLKMLGVDAQIIIQDFLEYDPKDDKYDIVFSAGFIEHFLDPAQIVERICSLAKRYVVTIVPNCSGINGLISRLLRPRIYAEHIKIDTSMLEKMHEMNGVTKLFCNYAGGVRIIMPGMHNKFVEKYRLIGQIINAPFKIFNILADKISRALRLSSSIRILSENLMYIGYKK